MPVVGPFEQHSVPLAYEYVLKGEQWFVEHLLESVARLADPVMIANADGHQWHVLVASKETRSLAYSVTSAVYPEQHRRAGHAAVVKRSAYGDEGRGPVHSIVASQVYRQLCRMCGILSIWPPFAVNGSPCEE